MGSSEELKMLIDWLKRNTIESSGNHNTFHNMNLISKHKRVQFFNGTVHKNLTSVS